MRNDHFRRGYIAFFGLILLIQVLFWSQGASAARPFNDYSNHNDTHTESLPAGLTHDDWRLISRQTNQIYSQEAYLKASNAGEGDWFGFPVAISGDTVVVGAFFEDGNGSEGEVDNSANHAGAVYVFVRSSGGWTQQAYLKASNVEGGDYFGGSVAICGDTLVVGATGEDSNGIGDEDNNSAEAAGAVYIFVRSAGVWTQQAYLKASNAEAGDRFGSSVAIDGDTVIIGAPNENDSEGAVYVFQRSGEIWDQLPLPYLKASNAEAGDEFGGAVAISGKGVVIGAIGEDSREIPNDNLEEDAGAAYFFYDSNGTWSQKAYLKASNAESGDSFGVSVDILEETIIVGADGEASNGSGEGNNDISWAGAAYVYQHSGGKWEQQAYLKADNPGEDNFFGESVAISQDKVIVGAFGESNFAGAVYVFNRSDTKWTKEDKLKAENSEMDDLFGLPVAVSGDTLVVGAYGESSDGTEPSDNSLPAAGAAYIFHKAYSATYLPLIIR